jgi:hypothetical protein
MECTPLLPQRRFGVATLARAWKTPCFHRLATVATTSRQFQSLRAGRRRTALATLVVGGLWVVMCSAASAQRVVLQPLQKAAQLRALDRDAADVFLPRLQAVLTAELHFIKKVCGPDEQQFNNIQRAGQERILALARQYSELKRKRAKLGSWPPATEKVIDALADAVVENIPADAAETYRSEIAARLDARRAADASAVVIMIDRQVMLDPQQQQALFEALRDGWQPHWSNAYLSHTYSNYAVYPETEVLSPHLAELQQRLWIGRPRRRYASLMWQLHFRVYDIFGIKGLADFGLGGFADPDANVDAVERE